MSNDTISEIQRLVKSRLCVAAAAAELEDDSEESLRLADETQSLNSKLIVSTLPKKQSLSVR